MTIATPTTDLSLIARLGGGNPDPEAWDRFVRRYGPRIRDWCRAWGLQSADADDVAQNILLRVVRKVHQFRREGQAGTFRGWLRRVAATAHADFAEKARASRLLTFDPVSARALRSAEAREDLLARLSDEYDLELAAAAMARVRERVEPQTWEMFERTAVAGEAGTVVAARLGVAVGTVYAARSKIRRMMRDEMDALDADAGGLT